MNKDNMNNNSEDISENINKVEDKAKEIKDEVMNKEEKLEEKVEETFEKVKEEVKEKLTEADESLPRFDDTPGRLKDMSHTHKAEEEKLAKKTLNTEVNESARKKTGVNKSKIRYGTTATIMTVVFIAVVIVINILVSILTERFPSMNIDLTAQKLNTLSEQAVDIAKGVTKDTEIFIIGNEDAIRNDELYANYGIKYSQVVNLAEKMKETNPKISVKFVDPDTNPEFINSFESDILSTGKVLVQTEARSKVLDFTDLYNITVNQELQMYESFSKVDGALANAVHIVNLEDLPVLAAASGHEEMIAEDARAGLDKIFTDMAFDVVEFDMMFEEIPEDTDVLFLGTPTTDYAPEEIDKLREFLSDETATKDRALLYTCYPTQGNLPNLASFLEEWGVVVDEGIVVETDGGNVFSTNPSYIKAESAGEAIIGTYSKLVSPMSSPISLLFDYNDEVSTTPLWTSSNSCYIVIDEESEETATEQYNLATLSMRQSEKNGKVVQDQVVVFGSSLAFVESYGASSTFSNMDYFKDLITYMTNAEATDITIEEVQTTLIDVSASASTIKLLGLGVFTIGLPLIILIVGLVIFFRRRNL